MGVRYGEAGPALLSPCRTYRYTLERIWDSAYPRCAFIGLNPSTADESQLDPTLRRCVRFADSWGYGSFTMLNLFAYRSTKPDALTLASDPVGPDNDKWILHVCREVAANGGIVICCWGSNVGRATLRRYGRVSAVLGLIQEAQARAYAIRFTAAGHPEHPLYLPSNLEPERYQ